MKPQKCHSLFYLALIFFGSESVSSPYINHCTRLLAGIRHTSLSTVYHDVQYLFLETVFLPVVGMRGILRGDGSPRNHLVGQNFIEMSDYPGCHRLRFEWVKEGTLPSADSSEGISILKIPLGFDWSSLPDRGKGLIQSFLVGHSLHPFGYDPTGLVRAERAALGESTIFLRSVQAEATSAALDTVERFEQGDSNAQRFLYVAPTGTGKTEVLKAVLKSRLGSSNASLHVVVADRVNLVDQLFNNVIDLNTEMQNAFRAIQWGGNFRATSFTALLKEVEHAKKPVVLVTTIQSLKLRYDEGSNEEQKQFREMLGTFAYDEAHHSTAPETLWIINSILENNSNTFLMGTTATPTGQSNLQRFFGNNAFWAFLDTQNTYRLGKREFYRPLVRVLDQLELAINNGELSPLGDVFFMDPVQMASRTRGDFFVPSGDTSIVPHFVINPTYYGRLIDTLKPILLKHEKGFIATNSIPEAQALTEALNQRLPDLGFAAIYSRMDRQEERQILFDFRHNQPHELKIRGQKIRRRINHIVTVRKFDEGLDFPDLTLLVDLSHSVSPTIFLQRLGRILRLVQNKRSASFVSMMHIDSNTLRDLLLMTRRILNFRFYGAYNGHGLYTLPHNPILMTPQELDIHLRQSPFWLEPDLSPAERVAEDFVAFLDELVRNGEEMRMPRNREKYRREKNLFRLILKYENNRDFIVRLNALNPNALQILERKRTRRTFADCAAYDLIDFINQLQSRGEPLRLPRQEVSAEERSLYERLIRYRNHAKFREIINRQPVVLRLVERMSLCKAERVADDFITFLEGLQIGQEALRMPCATAGNPEILLYRRINQSKFDQRFRERLLKNEGIGAQAIGIVFGE